MTRVRMHVFDYTCARWSRVAGQRVNAARTYASRSLNREGAGAVRRVFEVKQTQYTLLAAMPLKIRTPRSDKTTVRCATIGPPTQVPNGH